VLYQLVNEEKPKYDYIIVDEFARENRYYEYLNGQVNVQRGITFLTKAEDISPAVGCASIISRYIFLKEFDKICDSIHIPLPKGAGKDVDTVGEEVVEKYGKDKLKEISKYNFKNTDRILHTMVY
ncbi:MAG: ribonuclease HIII, partial [Bacilli bacterium]|nr:ribonuclease HIII [Bacilli bacterium]